MRLTKIHYGMCANILAIPFCVGVEEDDGIVCYGFHFLWFYIGFTYTEVNNAEVDDE